MHTQIFGRPYGITVSLQNGRWLMVTVFFLGLLIAVSPHPVFGQGSASDYQRMAELPGKFSNKVFRTRITPNWVHDEKGFWYRIQTAKQEFEFVVAKTDGSKRALAFDHHRVAEQLAELTKKKVTPQLLPFQEIVLDEEFKTVYFKAFGRAFQVQRSNSDLKEIKPDDIPLAKKATKTTITPNVAGGPAPSDKQKSTENRPRKKRMLNARSTPNSPDRKWQAKIEDHDVVILNTESGQSTQVTTRGRASHPYINQFYWSPDSQKLIAFRERPAEEHIVYKIESSPQDQVQPKLHRQNYLKPGDRIRTLTPKLIDLATMKEIPVESTLFDTPWRLHDYRWANDSSEFYFRYNQRGHQVMRLVGINTQTGKARAVIDEVAKTFIDYNYKFKVGYLDASNEVIWSSERDGYNHLYLYDVESGKLKNQITRGKWLVRKIDRVDEDKRQIWFQASGIVDNQDPYYIHFCRVDFSGENLVVMTGGDGTHRIEYSPSKKYLIDTFSRVDLPPSHTLRNVTNGELICELESGDHSALLTAGWRAPERFVASGRDGRTPIFGVIYRPTQFDPEKKYPVIEYIYAGPHGSFVPKEFSTLQRAQALTELGFIVVQIDGMGTSNRSKEFHDVCWKNLGDSGFPDRMLWLKAAAKRYPSMDLSRVGIFGGSAGGQSALRALLAYGDFYHVAVSDCGCHDNRMDKIWWNEQWMGYPVGPHYGEQSNVTNAHRLKGKLFLIVGEMDSNVDPASTLQVVNALIKADKDFDFLLVPGGGHGIGSRPYGRRRTHDFFVRHLLGVEPRHP